MVLDDVAMSVKLLKGILSTFGEVHGFTKPFEALDALRLAYKKDEPYDLLILDIMMPEISGFEVLSKKRMIERKHQIASRTKVIMLTARNERASVVRAVQGGAEGYILKPFQREKVEEEVRKALAQNQENAHEADGEGQGPAREQPSEDQPEDRDGDDAKAAEDADPKDDPDESDEETEEQVANEEEAPAAE